MSAAERPPSRLEARRKSVRWKLIRALDRLPFMCWAELVTWWLWREPHSLRDCRIDHICRGDFARNDRCYCGKLRDEDALIARLGVPE